MLVLFLICIFNFCSSMNISFYLYCTKQCGNITILSSNNITIYISQKEIFNTFPSSPIELEEGEQIRIRLLVGHLYSDSTNGIAGYIKLNNYIISTSNISFWNLNNIFRPFGSKKMITM